MQHKLFFMDDQNDKIRQVLNECLLVLGAPKELRDVFSCWRNGISDESVIRLMSIWVKENKQLNNMPSDNTNRPILLEIKSPLVGSLNVSVPCKCCNEVNSDYHHNPNKESFQIAHNIRHLVEKALLESLTTSSAVPEILLQANKTQ